MSGYLLDTNVASELRKRQRAHPKVLAWINSIPETEIFVSVLVLGEIRKGVELARRTDREQARALERWLTGLQRDYSERVLPVTAPIADRWGRLNATRPVSTVDGLLAATALIHDLTLATRNVNDVIHTGVKVLNPFAFDKPA